MVRGPAEINTLNLRSLVRPADDWGPALQENRTAQLPQDLPTLPADGATDPSSDPTIQHREDRCFVTESAAYGSDDRIVFAKQGDTHI